MAKEIVVSKPLQGLAIAEELRDEAAEALRLAAEMCDPKSVTDLKAYARELEADAKLFEKRANAH